MGNYIIWFSPVDDPYNLEAEEFDPPEPDHVKMLPYYLKRLPYPEGIEKEY